MEEFFLQKFFDGNEFAFCCCKESGGCTTRIGVISVGPSNDEIVYRKHGNMVYAGLFFPMKFCNQFHLSNVEFFVADMLQDPTERIMVRMCLRYCCQTICSSVSSNWCNSTFAVGSVVFTGLARRKETSQLLVGMLAHEIRPLSGFNKVCFSTFLQGTLVCSWLSQGARMRIEHVIR